MRKRVIVIAGMVLFLILAALIGGYNGLAGSREDVNNAAANVDAMLQRRAELIPNLVSSVKGYATHETEVFDAVLEARKELLNAANMQEKADADADLTTALSRLNLVVESYPDLKSDTVYTGLMDELAGSENRISTARKDYNDVVRNYNRKCVTFPTNILATMFHFEKADYFEASAQASETPDVEALLNHGGENEEQKK